MNYVDCDLDVPSTDDALPVLAKHRAQLTSVTKRGPKGSNIKARVIGKDTASADEAAQRFLSELFGAGEDHDESITGRGDLQDVMQREAA